MGTTRTIGWLLTALVLATPARADEPPDDAELALQANEVHQQHCAELYASDVQQAAGSYQAVGEMWGQIDQRFEATDDSYWLYWRGLMAECLGQTDQGAADLLQFVATHADQPGYQGLVKEARQRARRIQAIEDGERARGRGARRSPIAFVEDPAAELELNRYELKRYRNSGYVYDDWKQRRHSLRRHVVLMWSLGVAHGHNALRHVEMAVEGDGEHFATSSLMAHTHFRSSVGLELWPWHAASIGMLFGLHMSPTFVGVADATSYSEAVDPPATLVKSEDNSTMIDARLWTGFTLLPFKRFKPLLRLPVLGYRWRGGEDGLAGGRPYQANAVGALSLGGYAGVAAALARSFGLEAGVWLSFDLTDSTSTDTSLEGEDWSHLQSLETKDQGIEIRFHVAIRLAI
jgi:hypothetical protein